MLRLILLTSYFHTSYLLFDRLSIMDTLSTHISYVRAFLLCRKDPIILPFDGNLTLRQWMYKVADLFSPTAINGDELTFEYGILQDGKLINKMENRHCLVSKLINTDIPLYCSMFVFNPSQYALIKGNLSDTFVETNEKICQICLEKMNFNNEFVALKCFHTFHIKCIKQLEKAKCPTCDQFDETILLFITK